MQITGFGANSFAGSYKLGEIDAEEDLGINAPLVLAQVGGASGSFDFYGGTSGPDQFSQVGYTQSPISPQFITRRFKLKSTTYANMKDAYDDLILNTIAYWTPAEDQPIMHGLRRDGTTIRTPGKCTAVAAPEVMGQYLTIPVELTFYNGDGLWYGTGAQTVQRNGAGTVAISHAGNYPAMVAILIASGVIDPTIKIKRTSTPAATVCEWTWTGTTAGSGLLVDPTQYSATNGGADVYTDLAIGSGQIAWLWLPPTEPSTGWLFGDGVYELEVSAGTIGAELITATFFNTYLF